MNHLIESNLEKIVLLCQNNMRGLLGFTLALQNFNAKISAIALLYIVISTLLVEPVMNYLLVREFSKEQNN
jgi:hypothetical protein